jgi:predicted 2-oxoglutarate/Fe(II)-dependent dioxygenase YbiX
MYPRIVVTPNYFPATWCDNVNNWIKNNVPINPSLGKAGVRKCDVRLLTQSMKPYDGVFQSMIEYTKAHISKLHVDIDYKIDGAIQHITYQAGHGVGWHDDTLNINAALESDEFKDLKRDRKASLTVMLSDPSEYEGGEFVFDPNLRQRPVVEGKGTVALFTSFSPHMVKPITSGTRNILFIFITGPAWR